MKSFDTARHARGASVFLDDMPLPEGTLHAAVLGSPVAHGRLVRLDATAALERPGVHAVLTAADVPAENSLGPILQDETLFVESDLRFHGHPVALVVAESLDEARLARADIRLEVEEREAVLEPREAAAAGELLVPSRTIECGDIDAAFSNAATIVEGSTESGGQEHLYLETQGALAIPEEKGRVRIIAGTQSPANVQRMVARILGVPMNAVEIEVRRLGGAFGGKEDQATHWAAMAAVAALRLGRAVKLVLPRGDDMRMTGKRHPYQADYRLGLDANGKIVAYDVTFFQNGGAAADLSPAVLERTLLHATNAYAVPNARITGYSCRTNLPPFTAFRGFGGPQAMFVMESALTRAAEATGIPASELQRRNLLEDGDVFPYGQTVVRGQATRSFDEAADRYDLAGIRERAREFNESNRLKKRGVSVMPVCFGISFTKTFLNQAAALVHVYNDGSVSVTTGAVEMGQGVNKKILAIAAHSLGIPPARVSIEATTTSRVANTSPTAASAAADLNGGATRKACLDILERLRAVAARELGADADSVTVRDGIVLRDGKPTELDWNALVTAAFLSRTNLSAHAHYATPGLSYDPTKERGEPFAYHVFGAAITEATVDCLRGTYTLDAVHVVHDGGRSLDPLVDLGQVEGGLVQGIGWMTMEEVVFDQEGRLRTDTLSTYKVPDIRFAPARIETHFLEDADNPDAVLQSKGIGEPPLMYGIGAYFAIQEAIAAYRPDRDREYTAPLTPERVLMQLHGDRSPVPASSR